jgi:hypothetical protein
MRLDDDWLLKKGPDNMSGPFCLSDSRGGLVAGKLVLKRQQQRLGNCQVVWQGGVGMIHALFENPDVIVTVEGYIAGLAVQKGMFICDPLLVYNRVGVGHSTQIEHVMHEMVEVSFVVIRRLVMLLINGKGSWLLCVTG